MSAKYVVLGLGSNISPRKRYILRALSMINTFMPLAETSSLVETTPWNVTSQQKDYFNLVAVFRNCPFAPRTLLKKTSSIEQSLGRSRKGDYAARTIDLDILFYDQRTIHSKDLIIPHPGWNKRPFVYRLLAECSYHEFLNASNIERLRKLTAQNETSFIKVIENSQTMNKIFLEYRDDNNS